VRADDVLVRAEHRDEEDWPALATSIEKELGRVCGRTARAEMVAPGTLYDYRSIRSGKPLSRIVDEVRGTSEVIEGM